MFDPRTVDSISSFPFPADKTVPDVTAVTPLTVRENVKFPDTYDTTSNKTLVRMVMPELVVFAP